ncbi:single-stranded-DNA-specific exonuclease RecJ [Eikenella sp. S3360]|uniref:Single-stranded-DNA-specific exonuclease RecJ n=1 Tax=Eikenella glucosivorans TaxID=2766967 RepID=A0ABS0N9C8_9NEIS|nr:single-stranded-DNA-specific exonuclease RecJ [Eikenella glucosivorans]MBH5328869.1 single-stranded-DNA-specific exonuclease RecJ [Eikenella glucosivorans]
MTALIRTRQPDTQAEQLLLDAGTPPLLARLFASRNVHSPNELHTDLASLLPFQSLKNIDAATNRLMQAIRRQERILIIADYDVDGATACSVGVLGLRRMGAHVDFLVPNRFKHGYGLTPLLADLAAQRGTQLLLTVDNGMSSAAGVVRAKELSMDVIITDHHLPSDELPDCIIVNPNQPGCDFASKNLAGVGVIFYVLMALRAHLRAQQWFAPGRLPEPNLADLLDLVALGTVADVVTLDHNNRILVTQGIKRMRAGKTRIGIRSLFQVAKRDMREAKPFDLGFAIGPRINAAGRLEKMDIGIACLLADDPGEAAALAEQLNELNRARQDIEQSMLQEAVALADQIIIGNSLGITAFHSGWHQGVIGIVAGRLKDRFHRPAIVFAPAGNGELRGSGRSIPGLHLRDAIDLLSKRHPDLILQFGGHAMAAGLSIREQAFPDFQVAFETLLAEVLDQDALTRTFLTDGSLNPNELSLQTAETLSRQVWGHGFQPPSFHNQFEVLWQRIVGNGHKKAGLNCGGRVVEAMFFRCTDELPAKIRTVYRPVANQWRNQCELQLHIEHWEAI